ncbi:sensor histidine kinase [Nocardioides daejeonensis]|uniref:sensor histidine kinase n=1 Tax=Nocardioides daejeonensis TaxID=1046556 RepID=UPI0013A5559A|nr:sensor histidine kinase [Nocardioides daejeonensis]
MDRQGLPRRLLEDPRGGHTGWAGTALESAVERVVAIGMLVWQVPMVATSLALDDPVRRALLVAAHGSVALLLVLALRRTAPLEAAIVAVYPVFVLDWWASPSVATPLLFAACWMMNLNHGAAGLALRGRRAFLLPLGAALLVPLAMVLSRPERPIAELPLSVFVTTVSIAVVVRLGFGALWSYLHEADGEAEAAEREERALAEARAASREAAEDARMLHDTVINTLGAIANGGASVRDVSEVRARCARDVTVAGVLETGGTHRTAWADAVRHPAITVLRTGEADEVVEQHLELLPADVSRAWIGMVAELVQNAAKHSGADEVTVDVRLAVPGLTVAVSDDGRGFDGQAPAGRGLAESVLARAAATGLEVELVTRPGDGTRVTIAQRHADAARRNAAGWSLSTPDFARVMSSVRRRAAWLWSVGLIAVGVVLAVSNHHGELNHEYTMVAIDALACLIAWRSTRGGRRLPWWGVCLLAILAGLAFLASAAAVGLGQSAPVRWQALGATGPLVLLIALAGRRGLLTGSLAVVVTAGAAAAYVAPESRAAAAIVLLAAAVAVWFPWGWFRFHVTVARIGARAAADQRRRHLAQIDAAITRAAAESRARWRAAGLHRSLELLREMAGGVREPTDPQVRQACGEEEFHLRQLIRLDPDLVRMGLWLVRALSLARQRDVHLVVRTGSRDLDTESADRAGRLLLAAVQATPAGESLTVTLFEGADGMRLTLVAPHPHLLQLQQPLPEAPGAVHTLGDQDFVELMFEPAQEQAA